ncbi:hypothetical protein LCGC14_2440770, partial [marine sediment metagenome]
TDFSLDGTTNIVTLTLEDGGTRTIDLSGLVSTDDQQISLAGNTLTLEDGGTINLTPYLDNTDDQNISGSGLSGTELTIGIENGTNEVVDLSSLVGTDDQNLTLTGNILTLEDGGTVDLSAYLDNTDNQAITDFSLDSSTNIITLTLEDGGTQTIDLSGFVSTDDQQLTLTGTDLIIENGNTVDLSGFVSTDDQNLTLSGNILTLEDGGTVDLSAYLDNTDDQAITDFSLNGSTNIITLTLEDGGTQTIDLSGFVSTDNQNISGSGLSGTDLTIGIENGTNEVVDLSSLVGSDDQNLSGATLNASNVLQIDIENGTSTTVDLSALNNSGTDDQNLTLSGNTLTLEDGGTVDLSAYLDDTDDQTVTAFGIDNTTNVLTITLENGNTRTVDLSILDDAGSDDQNLTLSGNTLTLEDGGTVDLSAYLDNTDNQVITDFSLDGITNIITLTLEDGGTQTIDLSGFVSSDDQQLSLAGNTLTLEDGGTVNLTPYLDNTDDQNIENLALAGTILTVGIENGTAQTVD